MLYFAAIYNSLPSQCVIASRPAARPKPRFLGRKPKIYQGVRVKITVKELLQQRRAKQAVEEKAVSTEDGSGCSVLFTEAFSPPCVAPYGDQDPVSSSSSSSSSSSGCLQPWHCEEIPSYLEQLVDSCLQTEAPAEALPGTAQGSLHCAPDAFQTGPACLSQSLGPLSPDSSDPSSSFDCSFPPTQLPPFLPPSYSSPSPLDAKSCMYPLSEGSPYPQPAHPHSSHAPVTCFCTSCGAQHLDTFRVPEYFPFANADCRDFAPSISVADDFFRRDRGWDTCYS